ncbi:MAG: DUF503 domain-containing protein [Candidatus Aminicenantales bacterium]
MIIGLLSLEIHFPYSRSLKDKRKDLNSLKDRIRQRYNAALAELDFQNTWQRTKIGIVTLNSQKQLVERLLNKILLDIEQQTSGEICHYEFQFF